LIVGDSSTHGKGTVQTVQSLKPWLQPGDATADERAALKFTIRKFYRASGASTQLKGVMPDIVLPSRWNYSKDIGEESLENPMPWDVVPSERFDKLSLVQPYLSDLLKRSNERLATNQDFVYVREDIEEFRKAQADKTISLNEKKRLQEKDELEARQKARDKELRARKESTEKVYELTLKQADLPGLPPPLQKTNSLAFNTSGTNVVVASKPHSSDPSGSDENEDADTEEKPPAVDANLNEAERILMDYLLLLPKQAPLLATQGASNH
jgi:carboxyl-terminal processing protease